MFSYWTDNSSTEIKLSHQKFDQVNGNPIDQPEVEIETAGGGSIFIGEDNNRHENQINTERYTLSAFGTYYAGDHVIKGGFDYRSEEHTSELQSLMRISYAVFCLKKKTKKKNLRIKQQNQTSQHD